MYWCSIRGFHNYWCTDGALLVYMYLCTNVCTVCSMGGVHMSGVTASRGEMMQVTPDVARDQREVVFLCLVFSEKKRKLNRIF